MADETSRFSPLHLVMRPEAIRTCQAIVPADAIVVLLQDAVYHSAAIPGALVLSADAEIRGVAGRVDVERLIDYAALVELTSTHQPVVTW